MEANLRVGYRGVAFCALMGVAADDDVVVSSVWVVAWTDDDHLLLLSPIHSAE